MIDFFERLVWVKCIEGRAAGMYINLDKAMATWGKCSGYLILDSRHEVDVYNGYRIIHGWKIEAIYKLAKLDFNVPQGQILVTQYDLWGKQKAPLEVINCGPL